MSSPKVALYHPGAPLTPKELFVLSENPNGTVDLSADGKTAVVTNCPVSDDPKTGQASKPYTQKKKRATEDEEDDEGDESETNAQKAAAAKAAAEKAKK